MYSDENYHEKYYQENREKMLEYSKEWKKKNRDAWNTYQRERARLKRKQQKDGEKQ